MMQFLAGVNHEGTAPGRDPGFERAFLDDVQTLAAQIIGVGHNPADAIAFRHKVEERLRVGAERYGDLAYLERDNLAEVEEETPDVASYALLELQRLRAADPNLVGEVRADLATAAAYAAIADTFVRSARRKLA